MTVEAPPAIDPSGPEAPDGGSFARNVLPAVFWTILLFIGGGGPPPPAGSDALIGIPFDKLLHAFAFLVLQWLVLRALRYEFPRTRRIPLAVLAALLAAAIGVVIEIYQLALPDRSASVGDAVADALGASLGVLVAFGRRQP